LYQPAKPHDVIPKDCHLKFVVSIC